MAMSAGKTFWMRGMPTAQASPRVLRPWGKAALMP
jgi:hypothetical protein